MDVVFKVVTDGCTALLLYEEGQLILNNNSMEPISSDAAPPRRSAAGRAEPDAAPAPAPAASLPAAPPPLVEPARFQLAAPQEVVTDPALVGQPVLF